MDPYDFYPVYHGFPIFGFIATLLLGFFIGRMSAYRRMWRAAHGPYARCGGFERRRACGAQRDDKAPQQAPGADRIVSGSDTAASDPS